MMVWKLLFCVLLFAFCESKVDKASKESLDNSFKEIVAVYNSMKSANLGVGANVNEIIKDMKNDAKKMEEGAEKETKGDKEDAGETALEYFNKVDTAFNVLADNMPDIVRGIRAKDWKAVLTGASSLITTVLPMLGTYGEIAAGILKTLTKTLSLFGSKPVAKPSEIKTALEDQLVKIMKLELSSAQKGFDMILQDFKRFDEDKEDELELTEEKAKELLGKIASSMELNLKIYSLIPGYCGDGTISSDPNNARRCVSLTESLAHFSIAGQALMMQCVGYVESSNMSDEDKASVRSDLKFKIEYYREEDRKALMFYFNPLNSREQWEVLSTVYENAHSHLVLIRYLISIDNEYYTEHKKYLFDRNRVVICEKRHLKGSCRKAGEIDLTVIMPASRLSHSLFIPPTVKIVLSGNNQPILGPLNGLALYTSKNKINSYSRITMKRTDPSLDASKYVRICTANKDNHWCDTLEETTFEVDLGNFHGIDWTDGDIGSIYVPANQMLELTTQGGSGEFKSELKIYGPYTLRNIDACDDGWKRMRLTKYKAGVKMNGKKLAPSAKTTVTEKEIDQIVTSSDVILACSEPNLGGFCLQYEKPFITKRRHFRPYKTKGYKCGNFQIKSFKVPRGMELAICFGDPSGTKGIAGPHRATYDAESFNLNKKDSLYVNVKQVGKPIRGQAVCRGNK